LAETSGAGLASMIELGVRQKCMDIGQLTRDSRVTDRPQEDLSNIIGMFVRQTVLTDTGDWQC